MKKLIFLMMCSMTLTACHGFMTSRDNEYLHAKTAPMLQVPQGASSANLGEDYPVSGSLVTRASTPSMVPPGSLAASRTK